MAASSGCMFNFNVGVLGHVDSGKTSLSKALSTVASTASFDKNPQSKERGITLDLGFSSFSVDLPDHLTGEIGSSGRTQIQYTLVDCPGHASLIKTIIGGAQIIDLMMLVVDVTKGMQTQTAECLVIGEIACQKMIVVLNKLDLLPADKREAMVEKMKKKMLKTFEATKFANCPMVAVAAKPGGPEAPDTEALGLNDLIDTIKANTYVPQRSQTGPFIFSVDHCFSIRGQGTVMTGTALMGSTALNDTIEIPSMKITKKVKSIQMFKRPVDHISQGDRAGVCVTQFDPKLLERGLVCSPGALPTISAAIVAVEQISYYKGAINSKAKFHITTGHDTVMGRVSFFSLYSDTVAAAGETPDSISKCFDFSGEYVYQDELKNIKVMKKAIGAESDAGPLPVQQFALVEYEKPVTCPKNSLVIGSKLDTDIHTNMCRIAFHGRLLEGIVDDSEMQTVLPKLKVYKVKVREGQVERCQDEYSVIGKNLFKKETNIQAFVNLKVTLSSGERGHIEGGFGQSGKVKIRIPDGLQPSTFQRYSGTKKKGKGKQVSEDSTNEVEADQQPIKIFLTFKRFIYDPEKKMKQT
ncbi:selenocysteine-specific elongation factor-like [Mizuhopecten yessoensis]|uniref:Selenocysteine-specific elongation factor n=1 Tax=Mizuhopecten yessoensis TaxID=6573 RepID=A0A210QYA6_MIZYE|nr:selenocysteine-specific elongation factor-like [Mizuhopecten yessoensis]OWF53685.1 Selenocysteine-specific elongation factor [Mizuhopecten yessoensis]